MEGAARSLKVRLQFLEVKSLTELDGAFETAAKARAEGLVLLPTVLSTLNERQIAGLAVQRRLPTIYWRSEFAEAGGLMAYGPDQVYPLRRAGALVARILKGARPADLPVEQADRFRLVINLKTAKALGLTIPQTLLQRADQVIE
jgi:putative ABC transport system substrate-binding protein